MTLYIYITKKKKLFKKSFGKNTSQRVFLGKSLSKKLKLSIIKAPKGWKGKQL